MNDSPFDPNKLNASNHALTVERSRQVNRTTVNHLIRIGLLLGLVVSVALTILAAHPAPRVFGFYPGTVNTPNILYGDGGTVIARITVRNMAIVTFPKDWIRSDSICMTVEFARTDAPGQLDFNDSVPQRHWDDALHGVLTVEAGTIQFDSGDGSAIHLANNELAAPIFERTPYRIGWFGQEPIQLSPDQNVGGLLCANFQFDAGHPHLPPFFYIAVGVRNIHIESEPAFYFNNHDSVAASKHPPQTYDLSAPVNITDYLAGLLIDAPFAVQLQQSPQP